MGTHLHPYHPGNMYAGVSPSTRWQNDDLEPMRVKQKLKNSCSRFVYNQQLAANKCDRPELVMQETRARVR